MLEQAPLTIVVCGDMQKALEGEVRQLWIQASWRQDAGAPTAKNEEILTCLALGYPAEGAGPLVNHNSRKPIEETVTYL